MQLYLAVYLTVTVLFFLSWRLVKLRPYFLFVSFILLMCVFTFRDITVGIDTRDYFDFFDFSKLNGLGQQLIGIKELFLPTRFEIGFKLYTYFVSLVTNNIIIYLLISSVLIYTPIYFFIKRYSTNFYLSWVIYFSFFFFGSMSLLRQSIAMSILILGTRFIVNRNFLKYLAVLVLAISFHVTALVGIILYPLYRLKPTVRTLVYMGSATAGIFLLMPRLIIIAATINPRYEFYLDRINSFSFASFAAFGLYLFIFLILLGIKMTNKLNTKTNEININFLIMTAFIAMLIMGLSIRVNSLDRLSLFFMIYAVVSVPLFITKSGNSQYSRALTTALVGIFIAYASISLILRPEWLGVTKYKINSSIVTEGIL